MIRRFILRGASEVLCGRRALLSTAPALTSHAKGNDEVWENIYRQEVPRTIEEMNTLLSSKVVSPPNSHLLKVAIVGVPNSGKSTLINKLMGWRVCSSSRKVHTTQCNARAVFNAGSTQLVFLDTPGLVTPQEVTKHSLQRTLLTEPEMSLQDADLLAVVHDTSCQFTQSTLHTRLLRLLALHPTIPSVLVLNKVDLLKSKVKLLEITQLLTEGVIGGQRFSPQKRQSFKLNKNKMIKESLMQEELTASKTQTESQPCVEGDVDINSSSESGNIETSTSSSKVEGREGSLLNSMHDISHIKESDVFSGKVHLTEQQVKVFVEHRKSWPLFEEVFMLSAKHGSGVDDLRDFLLACAQPRPWIFSSQVVTDQNPEDIAVMTVREKFLDYFHQEIPYTLNFSIEHWELTESDLLNIMVKVKCGRKGLVRLLLGGGGDTVSKISKQAEQDLRNTFRTEVKLRLNIVYERNLKNKLS